MKKLLSIISIIVLAMSAFGAGLTVSSTNGFAERLTITTAFTNKAVTLPSAGTSNAIVIDSTGRETSVPFSSFYGSGSSVSNILTSRSVDMVIGTNIVYTVAHNLGYIPPAFQWYYVCLHDDANTGFSSNQVTKIQQSDDIGAGFSYAVGFSADTTNVYMQARGSISGTLYKMAQLRGDDAGNNGAIDPTSWTNFGLRVVYQYYTNATGVTGPQGPAGSITNLPANVVTTNILNAALIASNNLAVLNAYNSNADGVPPYAAADAWSPDHAMLGLSFDSVHGGYLWNHNAASTINYQISIPGGVQEIGSPTNMASDVTAINLWLSGNHSLYTNRTGGDSLVHAINANVYQSGSGFNCDIVALDTNGTPYVWNNNSFAFIYCNSNCTAGETNFAGFGMIIANGLVRGTLIGHTGSRAGPAGLPGANANVMMEGFDNVNNVIYFGAGNYGGVYTNTLLPFLAKWDLTNTNREEWGGLNYHITAAAPNASNGMVIQGSSGNNVINSDIAATIVNVGSAANTTGVAYFGTEVLRAATTTPCTPTLSVANFGEFSDGNTAGFGFCNITITTNIAVSRTAFGNGAVRIGDSLRVGNVLSYATSVSLQVDGSMSTSLSNRLSPVSISFPATTVNWTNSNAFNIELYIDNSAVTGTAIKKNDTTIFTSVTGDATIHLQPGDCFSETYTIGTPTAKWSPF